MFTVHETGVPAPPNPRLLERVRAAGVSKATIRRLLAGEPGIDTEALAKRVVRWTPRASGAV